ncbi:tetratricopeptide (TPR) repeat protein [Planomicrobium stackebrandtii]|uniref:Tetratricopeptide (TPR) repeat protein n=1 Tax=Planomicrobium stackebrandtii TaxID=253160 RepID=A0ABU0GUH6_9BACL|nr:helix-turn-helix transcriptional regulator [Planomicrobium stackebrandtii]MDQ0429004.1 tetratricopeptide (TPR) repeat protein [Planomicrobium stackebrandtii]
MEAAIIVLGDLFSSYFSDGPRKAENNSPTWMTEVLPLQKERRAVMDTGMRLKYHRLKQKISLEEAASGILSPRELKKIESEIKDPTLKDLEALCKKLEIPLAPKDNPIGKVLVKNFKNSLLHPQNKAKIMEQYADIQGHPLLHADEDVELEYSIQQIRYFIITGDLESAEEKIKEMERFREFMNQEQFYLFHKYNGNYNYILNDFEKALKTYLVAEKIAPHTINASEIGDLYYSIGISSTKCRETEMAFKYSEMALKIYQQEFIPKRIVECHLNIAISHQQFGNFRMSMEHYKNALTIGNKLEIDILRFTTEYNIGYAYFLFQNYELAITHTESSLKYIHPEYPADILISYCVLIKCNYELKNFNAAKEWLKKGLHIVENKKISIHSPTNKAFKEAYIEFICLDHLVNNNFDEFENYVLNQLAPSLEITENFFEMGYFLGHLGNIYYKQEKYKESAEIMNKARKAYKNITILF